MAEQIAVNVRNVTNAFGDKKVHEDLNMEIRQGEIIGLVGGSGAGKTVLLRTIVGLRPPQAGSVEIDGQNIHALSAADKARLLGVLFQHGALLSSLTVEQNVMVPLKEHTALSDAEASELARLKIALAGLPGDAAAKYPSELSGGMIKRASLARALALDPTVLFLDEPTSGLDPIAAAEFDQLISNLNQSLGVTVVMITHDLDTLFSICNRVAVLIDRKIIIDSLPNLLVNEHPWIKAYFHGARSRALMQSRKNGTE